jgi:hypothetical protein
MQTRSWRSTNRTGRGASSWGLCLLLAAGVTGALAVTDASALSLHIRPIDFGGGITATGTIVTDGASANITDWRLNVSSFERLAHYTRANTPFRIVSDVSVSGDGRAMSVATSPDGVADGGSLGFRARNPSVNWGVSLADFSSSAPPGGEAFYVAGAAFDFLPLDQPAGTSFLAAMASPSGGNLFDLVPLTFSGGVTLYGTILTSGRSGPLAADDVLAWDIFVDMVTTDVFDSSNSRLAASALGLSPEGQLTVMNPGGYLSFVKGIVGGHPYALQLADFTGTPGGQAGYFQGRIAVTTIGLRAGRGPWAVTGDTPITSVPEPGALALFALSMLAMVPSRLRRRA